MAEPAQATHEEEAPVLANITLNFQEISENDSYDAKQERFRHWAETSEAALKGAFACMHVGIACAA
jgi:hypothetical protein